MCFPSFFWLRLNSDTKNPVGKKQEKKNQNRKSWHLLSRILRFISTPNTFHVLFGMKVNRATFPTPQNNQIWLTFALARGPKRAFNVMPRCWSFVKKLLSSRSLTRKKGKSNQTGGTRLFAEHTHRRIPKRCASVFVPGLSAPSSLVLVVVVIDVIGVWSDWLALIRLIFVYNYISKSLNTEQLRPVDYFVTPRFINCREFRLSSCPLGTNHRRNSETDEDTRKQRAFSSLRFYASSFLVIGECFRKIFPCSLCDLRSLKKTRGKANATTKDRSDHYCSLRAEKLIVCRRRHTLTDFLTPCLRL